MRMPEATLLGAKVAASRLQLRAICVNDISVLLQRKRSGLVSHLCRRCTSAGLVFWAIFTLSFQDYVKVLEQEKDSKVAV